MRRVTSKSIIARDFVFRSNACLVAGLRPDLLRELRRFPDLIFRPQNHQKRLAAGLRPDPLGELERSPRPPSTVGAMEGNILAVVRALCGEKGGGVESTLEEVEMNEKGYF